MSRGLAIILAVLTLAACKTEDEPAAPVETVWPVVETPPPGFEYGPLVDCETPTAGMDRFSEQGQKRGLTIELPGRWTGSFWQGVGGPVLARDIDDDGDIDLVFGREGGLPTVFLNDGSGHFERGDDPPAPGGRVIMGRSDLTVLGDLDGDGLPELIVVDFDVAVWPNLGKGRFGTPVTTLPGDNRSHTALTLGDIDADGDLDLVLTASSNGRGDAPPLTLMRNVGGALSPGELLYTSGAAGVSSQVLSFTDRDRDGDMDLLVPNDDNRMTGRPTAFFRNESQNGVVTLVEDAEVVGADFSMSGMGIDSADLNGDGLLDYCVTDVGPARCLLSRRTADGVRYDDGTFDVSLQPAEWPYPGWGISTIGWSLEFADLDNDGYPEAVQAGAPDHGSGGTDRGFTDWPDQVWRGLPGGTFEDVTDETGLGDKHPHYGLVTADFDGNGALDIVVVGPGIKPKLHMNACTEGAWLEVRLRGIPPNPNAMGAIVEVEDSRRVQIREIQSVRAFGQSPARLHFGLGADGAAARVTIFWPDGEVTETTHVPVRRIITASHPDR